MGKKILIAANITALMASLGLLVYIWMEDILVQEESRRIVQECTAEVQKGCPLLYQYVSELEKQNAYLRQKVRECDASERPAQSSPDSGR